jgi:two-component system phosphate regulon sensor histidine kinase PhoR
MAAVAPLSSTFAVRYAAIMGGGFQSRALVSLALVVTTAAVVWLEARDPAVVLIVLVGATAATLYALTMRPPDPPRILLSDENNRAEAAARVVDAVAEPILLVETDTIAHANPAAQALLGGHVVGEDVRVAIRHPAAAERLAGPGGGVGLEPVEIVGLGARDQYWEMRVATLDEGRRLVHFTDRSGTHATERIRVDFVANASHELRTPLASLLGFIETLGDEAGDERATRKRFLKLMFDEARRMQRLVDDLISLSRIEAGKFRVPEQPVDLPELIREVVSELQAGAGDRGDDFEIDLIDLPPIPADRAQLSQLLHNIVGNAMKYGRPTTPLTIRLTPAGPNMVALTVTDEGEGIAPEHLPRLTERFYRVDMGRSRSMGGTGLGLAIVKHIVERHRGRLEITSGVGKGTTVTVLLPTVAVIKA